MKSFIFGPKECIIVATVKNLIPRPNIDASINAGKLTAHTPAAIVNTLYGIGVNALANIAQNAFSEYSSPTRINSCCKCNNAIILFPNGVKNIPMVYPKIPPHTDAIVLMHAYQ